MLIKCEKHTTEDILVWNAYEEADLLYYDSHDMKEKETKAIECIRNFCPNYVSVSWGKDSTVLAHLLFRSEIKIPLVWIVVSDIVNPYCFEVRNKFLKQFKIEYDEINIERLYEGNRFRNNGTIEKGFKIATLKYGNRYASGVRAEESGIRKIVMKMYGVETQNCCRPIGWWKEKEIFAYLAKYKLPVHPNYAMLGGGIYNRSFLRVASVGIKKGNSFDKELWEKEYYSDILYKIQKKNYLFT